MKDSVKAGTQGRTDLHLSLESRQSLELVPESLVLTQNPALLSWVDAGPANRRVHLSRDLERALQRLVNVGIFCACLGCTSSRYTYHQGKFTF